MGEDSLFPTLFYYNYMEELGIKTLKLTSPMPPSVNHYLAYRAIMKNGRPMAMSYKTSDAVKYQNSFKKYVQEEAAKQNWKKETNVFQHYYMDCDFFFPRIDMDANNFFKCLADSITDSTAVWVDDTQLCERVRSIRYSPENPRIEIEIYPVDYIGIFDNISRFDDFKSNCIHCKRYKNGKCSLFKKAIEGRIQDELSQYECSKFSEIKGDS